MPRAAGCWGTSSATACIISSGSAGPIVGLTGRLFQLPGSDPAYESGVALALAFASGAGGSLQMSAASFLGSGHRIEFYGEDGTLTLANPTADYFRGFELRHARRGEDALKPVTIEQPAGNGTTDERVVPVSRLVRRFLDACERGGDPSPGFVHGFRAQVLLDAARRSHASGRWIDTAPEAADGEGRP